MKRFIIMYHTTHKAFEAMKESPPEEGQKRISAWYEWRDSLGDNIVDFGSPMLEGVEVLSNGTKEKIQRDVTGYTILRAKDLADAIELVQNHPHLSTHIDNKIEVHELIKM